MGYRGNQQAVRDGLFCVWPALEFTTDLLRYPERLNAAAEIIDATIAVAGSVEGMTSADFA